MTLTLHEVFRKIAAKSDKEFKVTVTYLEARELLYLLVLQAGRQYLKLR